MNHDFQKPFSKKKTSHHTKERRLLSYLIPKRAEGDHVHHAYPDLFQTLLQIIDLRPLLNEQDRHDKHDDKPLLMKFIQSKEANRR